MGEKVNIVLEGMMPGANISEGRSTPWRGVGVCITGGVKHFWLAAELDFSPDPPTREQELEK